MRHSLLLLLTLLAPAAPAAAQVTVNPHALDPFGGGALTQQGAPPEAKPPKSSQDTAHRGRSTARSSAEARRSEEKQGKKPAPIAAGHAAGHTASMVHKPPVVPPVPPPVPVLAPMEPPPPAHPNTPPAPAPVVAGAPGEAAAIPDGVRVTFGSDSAELNPETDAALQKLAHTAAASPDATVSVMAYAAGPADDPSTPRRLSLSRALAARSVLITEGIPSTHIFLRALGSAAGNAPADRVDVTVSGLAAAAKPAQ